MGSNPCYQNYLEMDRHAVYLTNPYTVYHNLQAIRNTIIHYETHSEEIKFLVIISMTHYQSTASHQPSLIHSRKSTVSHNPRYKSTVVTQVVFV